MQLAVCDHFVLEALEQLALKIPANCQAGFQLRKIFLMLMSLEGGRGRISSDKQ